MLPWLITLYWYTPATLSSMDRIYALVFVIDKEMGLLSFLVESNLAAFLVRLIGVGRII